MRTTLRYAVIACLLALLLSACGEGQTATMGEPVDGEATSDPTDEPTDDPTDDPTDEPTDEPTEEPDDPAPAPVLKTCRNLTPFDVPIDYNDSPTVSCSAKHTALTYYVGKSAGDDRASKAASNQCKRKLPAAVGGNASQAAGSIFTYAFFAPSPSEWDDGARWYRCDLIARTGAALTKLKPLPPGAGPFVKKGAVPNAYAACLTKRGSRTTCDKAHGYRFSGTFRGKGRKLPGRDALLQQAQGYCPGLTGTASWYVTWPAKITWEAGDKTMACWATNSN